MNAIFRAVLIIGLSLCASFVEADTTNVWVAQTLPGTSHLVLDLKLNPRSPDTLYAATFPGTVFSSTNRGAIWAERPGIPGPDSTVFSLSINTHNPAVIYAGTFNGVYKTKNQGTTWTQSGLLGTQINLIQIMPVDTSRIFAATRDSLMRSTDGGTTWSRVVVDTLLSTIKVITLQANPLRPDTLYLGTDGNGVYRSRDGGTLWTQANTGLSNLRISKLAIHPAQPDTLYATTLGGGIFRSSSGAAAWDAVNHGISTLDIANLAIAPNRPTILYAGTQTGGIFRSSDNARSWFEITNNLTQSTPVGGLAVHPDSAEVVYAGLNHIYRIRQQGLVPRLLLQTGAEPVAITTADMNGDGQPDATVANAGAGSLSLFLNENQGTFFFSRQVVAGGEPVSLAAGDLNRDGKIDLVVGNQSTKVVSVLSNNGLGDFPSRLDLFVGYTPGALALADIDGNSLPDILTANRTPGNGISFFPNTGGGQFSSQRQFPVGRDPVDMAMGDFNNDGLIDVITADREDGQVSLLHNQGGGRFSSPQKLAIGGQPAGLVAQDIDRDGRQDVAVIVRETEELVVLRNMGESVFSSRHYPLEFQPISIRAGDIDRDGYPDLVISGDGQTVKAYINDGGGNFRLPPLSFDETTSARALSLIDIDKDGDLELLAVQTDTRSLFIRRNDLPQNTKPPGPPRGVMANDVQADLGGRIQVNWNYPKIDSDIGRVVGYRVHRAENKGGPFSLIETLPIQPYQVSTDSLTLFQSYIDSTATVGRTYFYTLVSVGPDLILSTPSDTVSAASRAQPFFDFVFSKDGIYHAGDTLQVTVSLLPLNYAVSGISLYLNYNPRGLTLLDADLVQPGLQPFGSSQSVLSSSQVLENRLHQSLLGAINYSLGSFAAPDTSRITLGSLRFLALRDTTLRLTVIDSPQVNRRTAIIERGSGQVVLPYLGSGGYAIAIRGVRLESRAILQGRNQSSSAQLRVDVRRPNGSFFPDSLAYRPSNDQDQNPTNGIQTSSDASGKFSLVQLPAGRYAIFVKSFHTLRAKVLGDSITVGTTSPATFRISWRFSTGAVVTDTLRGGDANDDNRVNLADFGILASLFGATGVSSGHPAWPADFNGDGAVNLADFGILASNFGEVGMGTTLSFKPALGSNIFALVPKEPETYALKLTQPIPIAGFSFELFSSNTEYVKPGKDLSTQTFWITRAMGSDRLLVAAHAQGKNMMLSEGAEIAQIHTKNLTPMLQNLQIIDGEGLVRGIGLQETVANPLHPALYPAFPNPFNPSTTIRFDVSEPAEVTLAIYSLTGQEIRTLIQEKKTPGTYTVLWDGTAANGRQLASGIYFYKISIGAFRDVHKLLLMK